MSRRAGNAPNQMADTVKIESRAVFLAQSSREQEPTRFVSPPQRDALAPLAVLLEAE